MNFSNRCELGDLCELYLTSKCPKWHAPLCNRGKDNNPCTSTKCTFSHVMSATAKKRTETSAKPVLAPSVAALFAAVAPTVTPATHKKTCPYGDECHDYLTTVCKHWHAPLCDHSRCIGAKCKLSHKMPATARKHIAAGGAGCVSSKTLPSTPKAYPSLIEERASKVAGHPAIGVALQEVYNAGAAGLEEPKCSTLVAFDKLEYYLTKELVTNSDYLGITLKKEVIFHLLARNTDFLNAFIEMHMAGAKGKPFDRASSSAFEKLREVMIPVLSRDW